MTFMKASSPVEEEVRKILNLEWNPFGININDNDDEYWDYAKFISDNKWTKTELVRYLLDIGFDNDAERHKIVDNVVDKILLTLPNLRKP
jgi:hypothetical protein